MALRIRLWRSGTRDLEPAETLPFAVAELPEAAEAAPEDEYVVEAEEQEARTPVVAQLLGVAQAILFGIVAVLSLAVFWTVGLLIGAF